MNKETRNAIQRSTQRARELLERELSEQLDGTYDIGLDGTIASAPGSHLDGSEILTREKLVAAVEHFASFGRTRSEAVTDYLREAAFTTLNRFVALKMLEARRLVQECVSGGDQSVGFKEFSGLAPGLTQLPDQGYRLYLESVFDEIGQEVGILFDRRDPSSLIWPRRPALAELLGILNAAALADVWRDDETIGWVYQYFNSAEERKQMRDESAAPRNTRELAVRNQFFTPRYVVRFLVDNTLARMWWQMRGGETTLVDQCEYLVFDNTGDLQRLRKDPRDLRILDPACGSGHFLLYAFDLLLTIYEEAWADEESPRSDATGRTLREDYASLDDLQRDLPALILSRNLYGVEIDPRASQIAALALWLRAQRAYRDFDVAAESREPIRRSHIIVAEPMPGDPALVEEFAEELRPPLLRDLFKRMVSEMNLAGELGTLLRVEDAIASSITEAREKYVRQAMETGYLPGLEPEQREAELDFSEIDDLQFFGEAEALLIDALRRFAESASGARGIRRWLFADDAAQGVALIDVLRSPFDVVLMNPPFGAATPAGQAYIARHYASSKADLLASFVTRGCDLAPEGMVGAITNRTCLFVTSLAEWRRATLLGQAGVRLLVDLGHGVLDGALVEAACYVLATGPALSALSLLSERHKSEVLFDAMSRPERWFHIDRELLLRLPTASVAYWAPTEILNALLSSSSSEESGLLPRVGLQTSDDFRFLRLQWEVRPEAVRSDAWVPFAKGGEYAPFADNLHLAVNWFDDAREQKAFASAHAKRTGSARGNDANRAFEWYYSPGLTYSERTTSDISVRMLPAGCITGTSGPGIYAQHSPLLVPALGYFSTNVFRQLLELSIGSGDAVESGSAARHYTVGNLANCPFPELDSALRDALSETAEVAVRATRALLAVSPTAAGPVRNIAIFRGTGKSLSSLALEETRRRLSLIEVILDASLKLEQLSERAFPQAAEIAAFVESASGKHPCRRVQREVDPLSVKALMALSEDELVDEVVARCGFSRALSKKTWYADRRVELLCAYFDAHPSSVISAIEAAGVRLYDERDAALDLLEYALGCALGDCPTPRSSSDRDSAEWALFDEAWALNVRHVQKTGALALADDEGTEADVCAAIARTLDSQGWDSETAMAEIAESLDVESARDAVRKLLFARHIARFSRSRRKAPIYWQLSTPSASFSVWLYAHHIGRDSLYRVLSDFVSPKLKAEERKLRTLREEIGQNPTRSQRKELAAQESFVQELRAVHDEVGRVASLWNPDLNDGVIIAMAPLWRLVPQLKSWQKELKSHWDALCAGKYDWAHLAMHLWPERVILKCAEDRSLAIAHDLEDIFWEQDADGKWSARAKPTSPIDELVTERTSPAVKNALESLLTAPQPLSEKRSRKVPA